MYFHAVATDYDGTLAKNGAVASTTLDALKKCKESGRRLVLVTGRELDSLRGAFRDIDLFDRIVAENGAVIFNPATEAEEIIGARPPPQFIEELERRGVAPLSVGRCIVATWEPHEGTVLEVIRDQALELHIVFNKGAVMILPPGVNKAIGLAHALRGLELSRHNVVAVGDAENDFSFLRHCGCSAAVANALPGVREAVDIRLEKDHGDGVVELLEKIARDDRSIVPRGRHGVRLGVDPAGAPVMLEPQRGGILIAGSSGVGKSTLATALTEHMADRGFEFCVIDPEGDYSELDNAVTLGDARTEPSGDDALDLLRTSATNVAIDMQALSIAERPLYFSALLPRLAHLRASTGRPHWLIIDEAHHLLPAMRENVAQMLPDALPSTVFVTVHPDALSPAALERVDVVIAVGERARDVFEKFHEAAGVEGPLPTTPPQDDEALFWDRGIGGPVIAVKVDRPRQAHKRHTRKYAEGELGPDKSFYFTGPDRALNLKAHNLTMFIQIGSGVDCRTWDYHRNAGHYSAWFRDSIKDEDLAREAEEIERDVALDSAASRAALERAINRRYTAPAKG